MPQSLVSRVSSTAIGHVCGSLTCTNGCGQSNAYICTYTTSKVTILSVIVLTGLSITKVQNYADTYGINVLFTRCFSLPVYLDIADVCKNLRFYLQRCNTIKIIGALSADI